MITNLVAAITVALVTNTTTRWPMHVEPIPCPDGMIGCAVYHCHAVPDKNPKFKWVKTTIQEETVACVNLQGQLHNIANVRIISEKEICLELKTDWLQKTNIPPDTSGLFLPK